MGENTKHEIHCRVLFKKSFKENHDLETVNQINKTGCEKSHKTNRLIKIQPGE
jgi:hypothetical protein